MGDGSHKHKYLLVFDIETIPDTDPQVIANLTGSEATEVEQIRKELEEYHLKVTKEKNSFLRQPFWKVVAISYLWAKIEYAFCKEAKRYQEKYIFRKIGSGGEVKSSEKELLQDFYDIVEKYQPRLVTFNGRGFDLPVLKYRAMKHGIVASKLYDSGDKWNSYMQRYSMDWHCDLLDVLSDFGASARLKLNEVCSILNFPGKIGVDGSQVTPMYDDGKIEEIRNYCETDVINSFLVYIRLMMHRATISIETYNQIINDIVAFINKSANSKKHLKEFLQEWDKISKEKTIKISKEKTILI